MSGIIVKGYLEEVNDSDLLEFKPSGSLKALGSSDSEHIIAEHTPISNQGSIGSCVGNATIDAFEILKGLEDPNSVTQMSRLFVYYNARRYHDATEKDSGTYISAALKSLVKYGVCREKLWEYKTSKVFDQPGILAYKEADDNEFKATAFYKVKSKGNARLDDIESALRSNHPVVFGIMVGSEYLRYKGEEKVFDYPKDNAGGHAQVLVGVKGTGDDRCFLVRNSWGSWGLKSYPGHAWISAEYLKRSQEAFVVTRAKDLLV